MERSLLTVVGRHVIIPSTLTHANMILVQRDIQWVVLRPAHLYVRHPYVMEIAHTEQWVEYIHMGISHAMVPLRVERNGVREYTLKVGDKKTLDAWHTRWNDLEVSVKNKT
jgi:hypothetical protein